MKGEKQIEMKTLEDIKTQSDYIKLYSKYLLCDIVKPVFAEDTNTPILKSMSDLTDEDAEEIGYDTAAYFHDCNKDYKDGIGVMNAISFKYLIEKGYDLFDLIKDGFAIKKKI